jgi:phosphoribosylglycinamide formyltransferase-1
MLKVGWFSTGRGQGARNLLRTVMEGKMDGTLDVEIPFVFCNWAPEDVSDPRAEHRQMFFKMVEDYGIPLVTVSWKTFMPELRKRDQEAWREEYGKAMREAFSSYDLDIGVLAGYMLWLDDTTCTLNDFINLHPALPDGPKGIWQDVIWELIEQRADAQGAMIHLCTPEWDRGAPLTMCSFSLRTDEYLPLWEQLEEKLRTRTLQQIKEEEGESEPLFKRIRADGAKRELPLIVQTIKLFADGRVRIVGKQLYQGDERLDGPFDLSDEVDRSLKGE